MNGSSSVDDEPKFSVISQLWDRQYGIWTASPAPPKPLGGTQDAFVAFRRLAAASNNAEPFTHIELRDQVLVHFLRRCLPAEIGLHSKPAGIDAQLLYVTRRKVLAELANTQQDSRLCRTVETLIGFVESEFADVEEKLAALPAGTIAWSLLWLLFEAGQETQVIYENTGEPASCPDMMAMVVDGWAYGASQKGRTFNLTGHAFQWTGVRMQKINVNRKILEFQNLRPIASMPIQPLTNSSKAAFIERSKQYLKYARQAYCAYTGSFVIRSHAAGVRTNGDGRVMIDVRMFRRSVPVLDVWDDDVNTSDADLINVADDTNWQLGCTEHLLPPVLHGFSYVHKKWGEFSVNRLSEVHWSQEPFEHLVLPKSYREVVRSLIQVHSSEKRSLLLSDVVQGKSSGCIIALYGNPGCGKTLTAEAVSEHLQRPLYSVTAGELGTSVSALEQNLKGVLDLASYWNAVLLIDEADVFLEKRDSRELERNGLVSIFLRVLEYFSGILILTTNRLDSFDAAFLSRFSLILKYPDLDQPSRRVLWERFLRMAKADPRTFDLDHLSSMAMNGRAIKQSVRTAQALALTQELPLSIRHLQTVLDMSRHNIVCIP